MSFKNAPIIPAKRRYKKIFQDDCFNYSTEDEEIVLYEKQDDFKTNSKERVSFSLSDLDLPKQKLSSTSWNERVTSCLKGIHVHCFSLSLILVFIIAAAILIPTGLYFLVGRWIEAANAVQTAPHNSTRPPDPNPPPAPLSSPAGMFSPSFDPIDFTASFPNTMSLSSPAFLDANGDSILDIVFAATVPEADHEYTWYCEDKQKIKEQEERCKLQAGHFYPCGSLTMAMSGNNGSILWEYRANPTVYAPTCSEDLTGDGVPDCMLCGRMGYWHAVDGRTGAYLWDVDHSIVNVHLDFFYPLPVGDLNEDGVVDFVNMHGGNPSYGPEERMRPPGRLTVVSGKNGEKLMDPIFVPDMKECYMNPVRYTTEKEDFVLFGTGGETIEGGLWAVTMSSLKDRVNRYLSKLDPRHKYVRVNSDDPHCKEFFQQDDTKPDVKIDHSQYNISESLEKKELNSFYQSCPETVFHPVPNVHGMCIYRVVSSPEKGVILPPVIIDVNGDNIDDLVVSLYAGHTLVMDGSTGGVVWDRYTPGTESYSIPAPLFFNEDDTPDFLVRASKGTWPNNYKYSYVGVVDGRNGELLWAMNSSRVGFTSATTLRAKHHGEDAILFMTTGQLQTDSLDSIKQQEIVTLGSIAPHVYQGEELGKRARGKQQDHGSFTVSEELDSMQGLRRFAGTSTVKAESISDALNHSSLSSAVSPSQSIVSSATSPVSSRTDLGADVFTENAPAMTSSFLSDSSTKSVFSSATQSTSASSFKPETTPLPSTEAIDLNETISFSYLEDLARILFDKGLGDFSKNWDQVFKYNPKTEPDKFIYEECSIDRSTINFYFLTPNMIKQKAVEPFLTISEKIAFVESNAAYTGRLKRHAAEERGGSYPGHSTFTLTLRQMVHSWGCSHVLTPSLLMAATPAMVDLNGDGEMELVQLTMMNRKVTLVANDGMKHGDSFPDGMSVRVSTLRSMFEAQSPHLSSAVDFSSFLPYPEQPWAQYMGRKQDSIYST